jgi:hypothetical protein
MAVRVLAAVLAVLGVLVIAAGAWMVLPAAGVIVGGLELVASAYVIGYLEARRAVS